MPYPSQVPTLATTIAPYSFGDPIASLYTLMRMAESSNLGKQLGVMQKLRALNDPHKIAQAALLPGQQLIQGKDGSLNREFAQTEKERDAARARINRDIDLNTLRTDPQVQAMMNEFLNGYADSDGGLHSWDELDLGRKQERLKQFREKIAPQLMDKLNVDREVADQFLFGQIAQDTDDLAERIRQSSGNLGELFLGGLSGAMGSIADAARGLVSSDAEKVAMAEERAREEQERIANNAFLENQSKRAALGDTWRLSGAGSSPLASVMSLAGEMAPLAAAGAVGAATSPVAGLIGGAALGAGQTIGNYNRSVAMGAGPEGLSPEQQSAIAHSALPMGIMGALTALPYAGGGQLTGAIREGIASRSLSNAWKAGLTRPSAAMAIGGGAAEGAAIGAGATGVANVYSQTQGLDTPTTRGMAESALTGAGMAGLFNASQRLAGGTVRAFRKSTEQPENVPANENSLNDTLIENIAQTGLSDAVRTNKTLAEVLEAKGYDPKDPNIVKQIAQLTFPDANSSEASIVKEYLTAYLDTAPATQAPATQAPATQAPATQAPATQAPATQAPATSAAQANLQPQLKTMAEKYGDPKNWSKELRRILKNAKSVEDVLAIFETNEINPYEAGLIDFLSNNTVWSNNKSNIPRIELIENLVKYLKDGKNGLEQAVNSAAAAVPGANPPVNAGKQGTAGVGTEAIAAPDNAPPSVADATNTGAGDGGAAPPIDGAPTSAGTDAQKQAAQPGATDNGANGQPPADASQPANPTDGGPTAPGAGSATNKDNANSAGNATVQGQTSVEQVQQRIRQMLADPQQYQTGLDQIRQMLADPRQHQAGLDLVEELVGSTELTLDDVTRLFTGSNDYESLKVSMENFNSKEFMNRIIDTVFKHGFLIKDRTGKVYLREQLNNMRASDVRRYFERGRLKVCTR